MNNFDLFDELPEGFRIAREEDLPLVTLTIAQAFTDYQYPIPTIEISYSAMLKYNYAIATACSKNALENGSILTNDDFSAVMLVTPFEKRADYGIDALYENLKTNAGVEAAENMVKIFEYVAEGEKTLHPDEGTVFIDQFAVQTPRQGQKLGSKLMRKLFEQCEKKNVDVLLYTNTELNKEIYNHFGYETINTLHEDSIHSDTFFLLWQPPKKRQQKMREELNVSAFYPIYFCKETEMENTLSFLSGLGFEKLHHLSYGGNSRGFVMGNDKGSKVDVFCNPDMEAATGLYGMRIGVSDLNKAVEYAKKYHFEIESDVITAKASRSLFAKSPDGLRYYFIQHVKNSSQPCDPAKILNEA